MKINCTELLEVMDLAERIEEGNLVLSSAQGLDVQPGN